MMTAAFCTPVRAFSFDFGNVAVDISGRVIGDPGGVVECRRIKIG
jgi:hypothetical protein